MSERDGALRSLEREIGVLMHRARTRLAQRAARIAPDLGPTGYLFWQTIADRGPIRAVDLAEMFGVDKGATSRLVRHLVEAGLVARAPDPDDGRASVLTVTSEGRQRADEVRQARRASFEHVVAEWTVEEIEQLTTLLGRLNRDG